MTFLSSASSSVRYSLMETGSLCDLSLRKKSISTRRLSHPHGAEFSRALRARRMLLEPIARPEELLRQHASVLLTVHAQQSAVLAEFQRLGVAGQAAAQAAETFGDGDPPAGDVDQRPAQAIRPAAPARHRNAP